MSSYDFSCILGFQIFRLSYTRYTWKNCILSLITPLLRAKNCVIMIQIIVIYLLSVCDCDFVIFSLFISSPEPSGSQGELIVYPYSGVRCRCCCRCRQQCLNIFSSETALPIKAKFYVEPPWEGGTKVYINGPGHMTKMAAMPIYGKNF